MHHRVWLAGYNGSNQLQRSYVTPGLDQNLSLTFSRSTYYYLSDALGRMRQVSSASESTQTRRRGKPRRGRRPHSYEFCAFDLAADHGGTKNSIMSPMAVK